MPEAERWESIAAIRAARARFEGQIPGWVRPAAHGTLLVPEDLLGSSDVVFPVVNVGTHMLPAAVLGTLLGRSSETATYELSPAILDEAIELLAPSEAARMYQHPNSAAWREMRDAVHAGATGRIFTVFVADLADPPSGPYDVALRAQVAAGQRAGIYADARAPRRATTR